MCTELSIYEKINRVIENETQTEYDKPTNFTIDYFPKRVSEKMGFRKIWANEE